MHDSGLSHGAHLHCAFAIGFVVHVCFDPYAAQSAASVAFFPWHLPRPSNFCGASTVSGPSGGRTLCTCTSSIPAWSARRASSRRFLTSAGAWQIGSCPLFMSLAPPPTAEPGGTVPALSCSILFSIAAQTSGSRAPELAPVHRSATWAPAAEVSGTFKSSMLSPDFPAFEDSACRRSHFRYCSKRNKKELEHRVQFGAVTCEVEMILWFVYCRK